MTNSYDSSVPSGPEAIPKDLQLLSLKEIRNNSKLVDLFKALDNEIIITTHNLQRNLKTQDPHTLTSPFPDLEPTSTCIHFTRTPSDF